MSLLPKRLPLQRTMAQMQTRIQPQTYWEILIDHSRRRTPEEMTTEVSSILQSDSLPTIILPQTQHTVDPDKVDPIVNMKGTGVKLTN